MMHIGFSGAGNMGLALAEAMSGRFPDYRYHVFDAAEERSSLFKQAIPQSMVHTGNRSLADAVDILFAAVKPQVIDTVLKEFAAYDGILVSIAAGITLERLQTAVPAARVVRVMPNTPCLVGKMAAGFSPAAACSEEDTACVASLLSAAGTAVRLDEELLDAVTGLSGSGPAFVARFIEGFIEAGISLGLDRKAARDLSLKTFAGTAELLAEKEYEPEELVQMVSSPGGTTVAGREVLENSDCIAIIEKTIQRAAERSKELGK